VIRRIFSRVLLLPALCLLGTPLLAHAGEHVTLRSGFSYDCVRIQPLDGNRTRLYLDHADTNYVELSSEDIVSVTPVPDPLPAPVPSPEPTASSQAALPVSTVPKRAVPEPDTRTLLAHAGQQHDIDVDLLASVVHAESGGRPHAISRTGARGLMQLMPSTAASLGVSDAFQPEQNINGGTAYLDALLTRYHDNLALALAAYNAGPAAVDRYHGIPPYRETRRYVARIIHDFNRRKALAAAHAPALLASATAPALPAR